MDQVELVAVLLEAWEVWVEDFLHSSIWVEVQEDSTKIYSRALVEDKEAEDLKQVLLQEDSEDFQALHLCQVEMTI